MFIHVVKPGDTVYSIALEYGISMSQLILDNGLGTLSRLAVGQALMVQFPTQTHTVQPGETLTSITATYQLPLCQLYCNDPILDDIPELYPGQALVLACSNTPETILSVSGYACPFIDPALLQSAIPYLTYLTSLTYGFTPDDTLVELDDETLLTAARQGGAAPLVHLSTLTEEGGFSSGLAHLTLTRPTIRDTLVDNLEAMLVQKDYRGLDVDFEYVYAEDAGAYVAFLGRLIERLNPLGYPVIAASASKITAGQPRTLYEGHDFTAIGAAVNQILLMTYEWGYTYGPPMAVAPLPNVRQVMEYALAEIPASKIQLGVPLYGYGWPLPFTQGRTKAQSISPREAVARAVRCSVDIQYSEQAQAPWYRYTGGYGITHEVWFEDTRSIQAGLTLILEYGLYRVGYWNLMRSFPQNWRVLNALYRIRIVQHFMYCRYARSLACLAVYGHFSSPLPGEKVVFRVYKTFVLNLKMIHHFELRSVKIEIVRIPEQSIRTPPLLPLFSDTQNHCTPAGQQTSLCGGRTKNSRAPVPECVLIAFHGMNFHTPIHTIDEVISMSYVSPAIRAKFDSMPPEFQEHVLQMDVRLETMSDLVACLERIVAEGERST